MPETPKNDVLLKKEKKKESLLMFIVVNSDQPSFSIPASMGGDEAAFCLFPDHSKHLVGFFIHAKMSVPNNHISINYLTSFVILNIISNSVSSGGMCIAAS